MRICAAPGCHAVLRNVNGNRRLCDSCRTPKGDPPLSEEAKTYLMALDMFHKESSLLNRVLLDRAAEGLIGGPRDPV